MKLNHIIIFVVVWIVISIIATVLIIKLAEDMKTEPITPTNQTTNCTGTINMTGNCVVEDYLGYKFITTGMPVP